MKILEMITIQDQMVVSRMNTNISYCEMASFDMSS